MRFINARLTVRFCSESSPDAVFSAMFMGVCVKFTQNSTPKKLVSENKIMDNDKGRILLFLRQEIRCPMTF